MECESVQNIKTRHAMPRRGSFPTPNPKSQISLCFFLSLIHASCPIGAELDQASQALTEAWQGSRSQPLSSWQSGRKNATAEESANPISNVDLVQPHGAFDWRDSHEGWTVRMGYQS